MDEDGDGGICEEIQGFFRGGVGGHYYEGSWRERGGGGRGERVGGEVGVVHQGDVGDVLGAGC